MVFVLNCHKMGGALRDACGIFVAEQNGLWISKAVHLSSDSSYSVNYDDGVVLEGSSDGCDFMDTSPRSGLRGSFSSVSPMRISTSQSDMSGINNFVLDVQVTYSVRQLG